MSGTESAPTETLDLVLFGAGSGRFGVEASRVAGLRHFVEGEALPRIEDRLRLSTVHAPASGRYVLRLKGVGGSQEINVLGPVDRVALPIAAIYPLPVLLAARSHLPALCALATVDGKVVPLLNPTPLLDPKFLC